MCLYQMSIKIQRILAIITSILLSIISGILTNTYRHYIYTNNIFDYHFADTIGSLACIPCSSLFFWAIYNRTFSFVKCILYSLIAFIIYEIIPFGVFDFYDIIAMLLSSGITWLSYILYKRLI